MNILLWIIVFSSVFGLSWENQTSAQCGYIAMPKSLIKNGNETTRNRWPWVAALIFKSQGPDKNRRFFCAATLISLRSVITAAHCMQEKYSKKRLNPNDFDVHLGRHNLSDVEEFQEKAKFLGPIVIIAMHPDWAPRDFTNDRYDADIALIIAGKEIETSKFILPICLPGRDMQNVIGTVVGWGHIDDFKFRAEDIPSQAQLLKVDKNECEDLTEISSDRTFCVKGLTEGASPCSGDSGGGFFTKLGDAWFIQGIVTSAFLSPNCPLTKHSLFTDVRPFMKWIQQGINEFYEVQFTYSFGKSLWGSGHVLEISEVLQRGAFLSMMEHPVALEVTKLWCKSKGRDWEYFPNNIGYLFPNLKYLVAVYMNIKSIERMNFKNMGKLEVLNLEINQIEQIPSDCFIDLKNLVKIYIDNNKLKTIHANTFMHNLILKKINLDENQIQPTELKNLINTNVEELDLQWNQLESVPFDAFDGLPNLKIINLCYNNLTSLHKDNFLNNPHLIGLYAAYNQIQSLPEGLFRNNINLNKLVFRNNDITEINLTFQFYGHYDFYGNTCINENFRPSNDSDIDELSQLNEAVTTLCGKK